MSAISDCSTRSARWRTRSSAADTFRKDAKVDDAAVKAYYDANQSAFRTPEEVKIEYVALTPDALDSQVSIDPAEVRKQYDQNVKQYAKGEERQASHILIAVKPDAKDDEKAAAKKKAEDLAAQARRTPARFAELAKENSQDPGSAAQGGDLGFFARDGSMVKPFEDAVFSGKEGDIIGPVQTDFGFHVIKVTGVKPATTQSFDEVKAQIEQDLKRQQAMRKFVDAASQFENLVYEQAESLQPVAKALNLKVQTSEWLTRAQVQTLGQNNPKFVQAVFSPDSLQAKRNTDAIEVAPNTMMAARVVDYKPAAPRAFDEVKADIRRQLEHNASSELAQKAGREKLALLQQGKDAGLVFGKPVTLGSQPGAARISNRRAGADLPGRTGQAARIRRHARAGWELRDLQDRARDRRAGAGRGTLGHVLHARGRTARARTFCGESCEPEGEGRREDQSDGAG